MWYGGDVLFLEENPVVRYLADHPQWKKKVTATHFPSKKVRGVTCDMPWLQVKKPLYVFVRSYYDRTTTTIVRITIVPGSTIVVLPSTVVGSYDNTCTYHPTTYHPTLPYLLRWSYYVLWGFSLCTMGILSYVLWAFSPTSSRDLWRVPRWSWNNYLPVVIMADTMMSHRRLFPSTI